MPIISGAVPAPAATARVTAANHELECYVFYLTGNFDALRKATAGQPDEFNKPVFPAEIESGHVLEAIKIMPLQPESVNNRFTFEHRHCVARVTSPGPRGGFERVFDHPGQRRRRLEARRCLVAGPAPTFAAHEEFSLAVECKSCRAATGAQLHPALRAELLPLITKLNRLPAYPHHLIETAMANLK